jgi:S-adenosyl-L-methionine methyltransferase
MSKLDSFIRRMQAQRDCLNYAARLIAGLPGPILELGLGNGRTYDHLREILPGRDIYVFDRRIASLEQCTPPEHHILLGEIGDTLPRAASLLGKTAALVHIDLGTSNDEHNAKLIAAIGPLLIPLTASNAIIVSNFVLSVDGWKKIAEPPGVKPGRYFLYQAG